nr:PREDICTED: uncharacterized protein LOC107983524 [Anolis carolinensis]|eukprot:XP_016852834.1 PREDICTED: uncharacterized protein LOC107983524 [Anolis carolinensis]
MEWSLVVEDLNVWRLLELPKQVISHLRTSSELIVSPPFPPLLYHFHSFRLLFLLSPPSHHYLPYSLFPLPLYHYLLPFPPFSLPPYHYHPCSFFSSYLSLSPSFPSFLSSSLSLSPLLILFLLLIIISLFSLLSLLLLIIITPAHSFPLTYHYFPLFSPFSPPPYHYHPCSFFSSYLSLSPSFPSFLFSSLSLSPLFILFLLLIIISLFSLLSLLLLIIIIPAHSFPLLIISLFSLLSLLLLIIIILFLLLITISLFSLLSLLLLILLFFALSFFPPINTPFYQLWQQLPPPAAAVFFSFSPSQPEPSRPFPNSYILYENKPL